MNTPTKNPLVRMNYLIKRRQETSREELLVHWFANHMPAVIEAQSDAKNKGDLHAHRYIATVFEDPERPIGESWDGMAQLWWEKELKQPKQDHGTVPTDTFQELAEPYRPWATYEYVILDGERPFRNITLNNRFPSTSSGFYKATFLVTAKKGTDYDQLFSHWAGVHAQNAKSTLERVGGFRYIIGHSTNPSQTRHAGMAELYFDNKQQFAEFNNELEPDGMEQWIDPEKMTILGSTTKMVGIP